jgi:hypothetical protein
MELWADKDFEMIAVEVKGKDNKLAWEIVGIYGAPNEDMRVIERLATQTHFLGNSTKCSITGGELNMPYTDWNGKWKALAEVRHLQTAQLVLCIS